MNDKTTTLRMTNPWMTTSQMLAAVALLCAFGGVLCGAVTAAESGPAKELADLTERVKTHRKAKDMGGLKGDLKAAVALHKANDGDDSADKTLRKKVLALIDSVPKGMKNDDLRKDMLTALGQTHDAGAGKYIKFYLKQKNPKQADDVLLTAIRVAGESPDGNLVGPLLKILTKSKHMGAAAKALAALGNYHDVKSKRVKILKDVISSIRKSKPGVKGSMKDPVTGDQYHHAGEETRSRWAALSQLMVKALGKLTGSENYGASPEDWFTMHDDNKRDLKALFSDDE